METIAEVRTTESGQLRANTPNTQQPECVHSIDGWISTPQGMRLCSCRIEARVKLALPVRFHAAKLDDFTLAVQVTARQWLNNPREGMLLIGPAGTGKTHLGAAFVRARIEHMQRALFRRLADFYSVLRNCYGGQVSERTVVEPLVSESFAVLDDLGAGALSDFERRAVLELLDRRANDLLPTVVTTNLTLEQVSKQIDDRVASRLSAFAVIKLTGKDHRLDAGIRDAKTRAAGGRE